VLRISKPTLLVGTTLLLFLGCEPPSNLPELGQVSGVVTLDGEPVAGATVQFDPDSAIRSQGSTDENGRYELVYRGETPGAVLGRHTVMVSKLVEDPRFGHRELLPERYWRAPTIRREVKPGQNVINLELTTDPEPDSE
jgi:hypothetical protein